MQALTKYVNKLSTTVMAAAGAGGAIEVTVQGLNATAANADGKIIMTPYSNSTLTTAAVGGTNIVGWKCTSGGATAAGATAMLSLVPGTCKG